MADAGLAWPGLVTVGVEGGSELPHSHPSKAFQILTGTDTTNTFFASFQKTSKQNYLLWPPPSSPASS